MSEKHPDPSLADATQARAQLYDTLSQLRGRLDYAQRVDDRVELTKQQLGEFKQRNPALFAAGVVGVATVAGLVVWGVAQKVVRLFD